MLAPMGFSFASVVLSYFLIAGGTFGAALLAGRMGIHSEYVGYIVLALGGFLGGIVAARASKGSTIIEPALGAVLLLASFIVVGVASSGADAHVLLLPAGMKAIALTSAACAGGGIAGAFVTEKLFADDTPSGASWILFVAVASFGAGVIGSTFGTFLGKGESGPLLGMLAASCFVVGIAAGASAMTRTLGASFLGGLVGLGAFFLLAIFVFVSVFGKGGGSAGNVPSEVYVGIGIMALGGGLATMLGSLIGWLTVGSKAA